MDETPTRTLIREERRSKQLRPWLLGGETIGPPTIADSGFLNQLRIEFIRFLDENAPVRSALITDSNMQYYRKLMKVRGYE